MSFFEDAIWTIGRGLAQTANKEISDATGYNIGDTMNFLFGNNQEMGGDDLANLMEVLPEKFDGSPEQSEYLMTTLSQQGQMLMDIGGDLAAISETMTSIKTDVKKIESLLDKIQKQQLYDSWQEVDVEITEYANAIEASYKTYSNYLQNYDTTPTELVMHLKDDILDTNVGPKVGMQGISKLILDNGQADGVLQLWSNMVCPLIEEGLMDYRDAVDQYISYYQKLAFAQLTATNLVMEAYNLSNASDRGTEFYNTYKDTILSQETAFISWLIPIITTGILYSESKKHSNYFLYTGINACAQLNPNFATLDNYTEYYQPSEILNRAEATLNALYNTDADDRRIVVYMTYLGYTSMKSLMNPVELTLTSTDKSIVNANYHDVLGPFPLSNDMSQLYPDYNLVTDTDGYYIKRFVYTSHGEQPESGDPVELSDGSYYLTNLNGFGNLMPQETYASYTRPSKYGGKVPFLADSILNFELTVDETTSFDFMNFLAYNNPMGVVLSPELDKVK